MSVGAEEPFPPCLAGYEIWPHGHVHVCGDQRPGSLGFRTTYDGVWPELPWGHSLTWAFPWSLGPLCSPLPHPGLPTAVFVQILGGQKPFSLLAALLQAQPS